MQFTNYIFTCTKINTFLGYFFQKVSAGGLHYWRMINYHILVNVVRYTTLKISFELIYVMISNSKIYWFYHNISSKLKVRVHWSISNFYLLLWRVIMSNLLLSCSNFQRYRKIAPTTRGLQSFGQCHMRVVSESGQFLSTRFVEIMLIHVCHFGDVMIRLSRLSQI